MVFFRDKSLVIVRGKKTTMSRVHALDLNMMMFFCYFYSKMCLVVQYHLTEELLPNLNGSNIFETMEIRSRHG